MRLLVFIFLCLFARVAAAEVLEVKSGAHDNYVRLVIQLTNNQKPVVVKKSTRQIELKFLSSTQFNVDKVFNYIDRKRLKEVRVYNGVLALLLGCECEIKTHLHDKIYFVLDIVDRADTERLVPLSSYIKFKNFWEFEQSNYTSLIKLGKVEESFQPNFSESRQGAREMVVCLDDSVVESVAELKSDFSYEDLLNSRRRDFSSEELPDEINAVEIISEYIALGFFQEALPLIKFLGPKEQGEVNAIVGLSKNKSSTEYPFPDFQKCSEAYTLWSIFTDPHRSADLDKRKVLRALDDLPAVTRYWVTPILKERLSHLGESGLIEEFMAQTEEDTAQLISLSEVKGLSPGSEVLAPEIPTPLLDQFLLIAEDEHSLQEATDIKLSKLLSRDDILSAINVLDTVELTYHTKLTLLKSIVDYAVDFGEEQDLLLLSSSSYWENVKINDLRAGEFIRLANAVNSVGVTELSSTFLTYFKVASDSKKENGTKEKSKPSLSGGASESWEFTEYNDFLESLNETEKTISQISFLNSGVEADTFASEIKEEISR